MEGKKNKKLIAGIILLAIVFIASFAGLTIPVTTHLFEQLIPISILVSIGTLLTFHRYWNNKAVFSLLTIVLAGFLIEWIGVRTGIIFGKFAFGNSLGWKINNTPLMVGLNWLVLVYITHVAVKKIGIGRPWIELTAAALMTALDYLIEPVAIKYDCWNWEAGVVPVQNFAAWFYISFFMQLFFNRMKPVEENQIAIPLLMLNILFFAALNIW
ncbi:MAG: carotenoid biosynthesis protein [Chitinophagaceae bacterium]|nr:carotenoid biosynthesis protein [Chitinophagaceae bacterium]